jgi:hypothetical protein
MECEHPPTLNLLSPWANKIQIAHARHLRPGRLAVVVPCKPTITRLYSEGVL